MSLKPTRRGKRGVTGIALEWHGDELLKAIDGGLDDALYAAGLVVLEEAQQRVPRRTGRLAESGYVATAKRNNYVKRRGYKRMLEAGPGSVIIAFSAPHAHLIEFGTRSAGKIKPKQAQALRLGETILRAGAKHKGIPANPFLRTAMDATQDEVVRVFNETLGLEIEQHGGSG